MTIKLEQIIVRNLSGEASPEDINAFAEWILQNDQHKEQYLKIKKFWDSKLSGVRIENKCSSFEELKSHIKRGEKHSFMTKTRHIFINAGIVATLAGIIIYLGFTRQIQLREKPIEHFIYLTSNSPAAFRLPDGTSITLNKNSKLEYSGLYGTTDRTIHLSGEGYFEVAHNSEKNFIVDMGETKISVTGTIFNIKNIQTEDSMNVTLVEGSVRFEAFNQVVNLKPDQQLSYNKNNKRLSINNVETDVVTAWKDHLIKYKSISFAEFVTELEQVYNVNISIRDEKLASEKISGSFDLDLTIDQILNLMQTNLSFKWIKKDRIYLITKKNNY